jgi:inhibitor of KinA sporulation pathway (predicted exonuclease)
MNYSNLCVIDFETSGKNPYRCQPIQLGAIMIDGRKLEILPNSIFCSYIQPIWDGVECERLGLDMVTEEILDITHITIENLKSAPVLKSVWQEFIQYINKYNPKKSRWKAPIKCGMNFDRYDGIIVDRIAGGHFGGIKSKLDKLVAGGIINTEDAKLPEPYGFGPWDEERQEETLFFPRDSIDLMRIIWLWTENMTEIRSLSMSAMREWLGISTEGSHSADKDVMDTAAILAKFLKLHRNFAPKVKFKDSFKKDESKISQ